MPPDNLPVQDEPEVPETKKARRSRLPRYRRVDTPPLSFELQERDRELLKLVYEHRFLTTDLLCRLVPTLPTRLQTPAEPKRPGLAIHYRAQKLFHHGYLDRIRLTNNSPCVYALGDKGADELVLYYGIDRGATDWAKKNREAHTPYISHTLMLARFRACLAATLRAMPDTRIVEWRPESKELRDEVRFQEERRGRDGEIYTPSMRIPINPDAFLTLEHNGQQAHFFIEADQSTMTNARFLTKLQGYWHWWQQGRHREKLGIESFRVLTLTKTEARKQNLRKVAMQADDRKRGSRMFLFTSETLYGVGDPATILGPVWQTPADDEQYRLLG